MMRFVLFLLLSLLFTSGKSILQTSTIKLGIFTDQPIKSVWISVDQGSYFILDESSVKVYESGPEGAGMNFVPLRDSVQLKINNRIIGTYRSLRLVGKEVPCAFRIKPLQPSLEERVYDHNLLIRNQNGRLNFTNTVNLEHYVAGVVESENGIRQNFEYYKLKSIICRTYALTNLQRHASEGFSLCDKVHCQVYHGKSRGNDDILMAAIATIGIVIVDSELNLITAAFHSNCGGQTLNSEAVWPRATTYLRGRVDTFCLNQPHAKWETHIPREDWIRFVQNYKVVTDTIDSECAIYYHPEVRENDFSTEYFNVPLRNARERFKLRSTYFSIDPTEDKLLLRGRGYGHGIGLCQEGAMRMADLGYSYQDILHFYYQNIHLIDLSVLDILLDQ